MSRLNILAGLFIIALFALQYRLWFESGGMHDMMRLKKLLATQTTENDNLRKRNEELLFQIQRLQKSQDAIESRARNELGMVKKNETFYQILK